MRIRSGLMVMFTLVSLPLAGCSLEARFFAASNSQFGTPPGVEDVDVPVRSGRVHAWYVPASTPSPARGAGQPAPEPAAPAGSLPRQPALLFCPGARFQLDDLLPYIRPISDRAGVPLMMVAYRGFGRSSPLKDISRATAADDAVAAYDALAARPDVDPSRIVVMGYSLGGPVALAVAARRPVAGVIVGGTFARAKDALRDRDLGGLSWLISDTLDPASTVAKLATREVLPPVGDAGSGPAMIIRSGPPILIFHGEADGALPVYHALALATEAARAGLPLKFYLVKDAGHRDVFTKPDAIAEVAAFTRACADRAARVDAGEPRGTPSADAQPAAGAAKSPTP